MIKNKFWITYKKVRFNNIIQIIIIDKFIFNKNVNDKFIKNRKQKKNKTENKTEKNDNINYFCCFCFFVFYL